MQHRATLSLCAVLLTVVACGLPSTAPPTAFPVPATPVFLPQPLPTSPVEAPTAAPAPADFTGTWNGPDPDDGSAMTMTLVQSGGSLTGTYSDSYSGSIAPPGFQGTVAGTVLSPTTGQIALNVQRHDGVSLNLQANLALSLQGSTLTVTITSASASPWVLTRQ